MDIRSRVLAVLCACAACAGWICAAGCEDGSEQPGVTVTSEGGEVLGPDGVRLLLPPGALVEPTDVRIERAVGAAVSHQALGEAYAIEPAGLVLERAAVVFVPFDPDAFWGDPGQVAIWQADTPDGRWAPLETQHETRHDATERASSAHLETFGVVGLGTPDPACLPACEGRLCGPDGCGGGCGDDCEAGSACQLATGHCECAPACEGRECGPDGCGGACGDGCGTSPCNEAMGVCLHACGDGECGLGETPGLCPADCPATRQLDLLFVVDDSLCMTNEQALLSSGISILAGQLHSLLGAPPELHVGVTTSNLGTAPHSVSFCEEPVGGTLITAGCYDTVTGGFAVDSEPVDCTVTRDATGGCASHTCAETHCSHEPGTQLMLDSYGCPRCRNFTMTLTDTLSCLVQVGTQGCGYEQPLEAMRLALDSHPDNAGFLRDDAVLAVVVVSDEDDCSAKTPDLFDREATELGLTANMRCFGQGVTCHVNEPDRIGPRYFCEPREDADSLLHPLDRYVSFLSGLRPAGRLLFSVLGAPTNGGTVQITEDDLGQPELGFACLPQEQLANPAIRLRALTSRLNAPADMEWVYGRVCGPVYQPYLQSLADRLAPMLGQ